ncbi:MAG TPA: hypothetical protein VK508_06815 [Cyclobacteriaceae bacterium]|nr:hypothetical protein [Cyclobacteriaceae bacterium]
MNKVVLISFLSICVLVLGVGHSHPAYASAGHISLAAFNRSSTHQQTKFIAFDAREAREEEDENELQSLKKRIESSRDFTAFFYNLPVGDSFVAIKEERTGISTKFVSSSSRRLYLTLKVFRL